MQPVRLAAVSCFAALLALPLPAFAQAKDAPPPVSAEPQNTMATYGDWVLRCTRTGDSAAGQRVCEIVQSFSIQGQQGLYAQVAIGRVGPKDPMKMTLLMLPNISFPSSVKVSAGDSDTQPLELIWRRCIPGGCIADAELKDDQVKRWRTATGNGHLQFKDANGRDVSVNVSFRGLEQALDGLAKS